MVKCGKSTANFLFSMRQSPFPNVVEPPAPHYHRFASMLNNHQNLLAQTAVQMAITAPNRCPNGYNSLKLIFFIPRFDNLVLEENVMCSYYIHPLLSFYIYYTIIIDTTFGLGLNRHFPLTGTDLIQKTW
jgi:hypothetical protein